MAVTPEGKVKEKVRAVLAEFDRAAVVLYNGTDYHVGILKQFWPVPSGYGASDIDCIVCYYGEYISIEVKAPGKKPKPRQELTLAETIGAGGWTFVIDGEAGLNELRHALESIRDFNANNS